MTPRTHRRLWLASAVLFQLLLLVLVHDLIRGGQDRRESGLYDGKVWGSHLHFRGFPLVWGVESQNTTHLTRGPGTPRVSRTEWRTLHPPNYAVPMLLAVGAVALPAAVFGPAVRAPRVRGPKPPAGRPERLARCLAVAAVIGVAVAAAEFDTAPDTYDNSYWQVSPGYAAAEVLTRRLDLAGGGLYGRLQWYCDARWWCYVQRKASGLDAAARWVHVRLTDAPAGENEYWERRPAITVTAAGAAFALAVGWWRPGRRAATTPPAA